MILAIGSVQRINGTTVSITSHWGGGEVTSADGLRFTVPV
jgi:hypothetical protein